MKTVPLLQVSGGFELYRELFDLAAAAGLRLGWLEWAPDSGEPVAGPPRRVVVDAHATRAEVARRGAPVLVDVLRSHFLGCDAVVVVGDVGAPTLQAVDRGWEVSVPDQGAVIHSSETLLDALRRPSVVRHRWQRAAHSQS